MEKEVVLAKSVAKRGVGEGVRRCLELCQREGMDNMKI